MKATLVQLRPNFCFEAQDEQGNELMFVQTDWDYPALASRFGWSLRDVQHCRHCKRPLNVNADDHGAVRCEDCGKRKGNVYCDHGGTDGTVDCKECGLKVGDFLGAAFDFLAENDGTTADWDE